MNNNFIVRESWKEMSNLASYAYVNADAVSLSDATMDNAIIEVSNYIIYSTKNSQGNEYSCIVISDNDGKFYATGSAVFIDNFGQLCEFVRDDCGGSPNFKIKVVQKESNKFRGKKYIIPKFVSIA